jgi:hypothetical protein
MNFGNFTNLISTTTNPVILIEGRRAITESGARDAQRLASMLAECFPNLRFRSGNAAGSDESFSSGVIAVAPERLEIIAPYATHRKRERHPLVHYESPESLDLDALEAIQTLTITATPANRGLIKCYGRGGRTGAQAACLIRDTLKVTGIPQKLAPPIAALFWIDPADPEAGGTGHTIRVCRNARIPTVFQNEWKTWLTRLS